MPKMEYKKGLAMRLIKVGYTEGLAGGGSHKPGHAPFGKQKKLGPTGWMTDGRAE